jgi:hypothetical protein
MAGSTQETLPATWPENITCFCPTTKVILRGTWRPKFLPPEYPNISRAARNGNIGWKPLTEVVRSIKVLSKCFTNLCFQPRFVKSGLTRPAASVQAVATNWLVVNLLAFAILAWKRSGKFNTVDGTYNFSTG